MEERQNEGIEQEKLKPKGRYAFKSFSRLFFFSPPIRHDVELDNVL